MSVSHEPVWWDQETGELFWELNVLAGSRRIISSFGSIAPATAGVVGGIKPSASVLVDPSTGVATVPAATTAAAGIVQRADAAAIAAGVAGRVVDAAQLLAARYVLPPATATVIGGVKPGANMTVSADGSLNAVVSGALTYKGTADPTAPPPAGVQSGWSYLASKGGVAAAGWTGIAGQTIGPGDMLAFTGTAWTASSAQSGVNVLRGTAPITVDSSTPASPLVGVSAATTAAAGVVQLADAAAIAAATAGRVVDAAQLRAGVAYPPVTISGNTYTLSAADQGRALMFTSASPVTVTYPPGLGTNFDARLVQCGTGRVTIVSGPGVVRRSKELATGTGFQYAQVGVKALPATNEFLLSGDTSIAESQPSLYLEPVYNGNVIDLISNKPLGGVTVSSMLPAWAVGPNGILYQPAANTPVIEYDLVTRQCLGARIWGITRNLNLYSDQLANTTASVWFDNGTGLSANTVISPDGTQNADTLTTPNFIYTLIPVTPSTVYTGSCFVKLGTMSAADYRIAVYDQTAGAFFLSDAVVAQTPTSSGWTRISYQFTTPAGCTSIRWYPFRNSSAATGATVHLYGSQVNAGSLAPYVPTTATAASSTADVWSVTGADFSRIVNLTEGTFYIEYGPHDATTPVVHNSLFTITTSTTSAANIIEAFVGDNVAPVFRVESNGVNQAYITSLNYNPSAIHKLAAAYKVDDFARSLDTQSLGTDTSGALPAVAPSILEIGTRNFGGVKPLNGYIRKLGIWRTRIVNASVQALTS